MLKKIVSSILLILFIGGISFAQKQAWKRNFTKEVGHINWIDQTSEGHVLVSGDRALLCANAKTGATIWKNKKFINIDKNKFRTIDGYPLMIFDASNIIGKKNNFLLNSSDGSILYSSEKSKYLINGNIFLHEHNSIIFGLRKLKERRIMCYNYVENKIKWDIDLGPEKSKFKSYVNILNEVDFINCDPIKVDKDNLVFASDVKVYSINVLSGKVNWEHAVKRKIVNLAYVPENKKLYLAENLSAKLTILDVNNGQNLTPKKMRSRALLKKIFMNDMGDLIVIYDHGFNMLDPKTGKYVWKKPFIVDNMKEVISYKDKFIAIGKNKDKSSVYLVDRNRKKQWSNHFKGFAYFVTKTSKGLLYISTERSNIIDLKTGKDIWKKDVKFRAIPAVAKNTDKNKIFLFSSGTAYTFSLDDANLEILGEKIKLDKVKKSTPIEAEYIQGKGYFVYSNQNTALIDVNGKLIYSDYYPAPNSIAGLARVGQIGLFIAGVDFDLEGSVANIKKLTTVTSTTNEQNETASHTESIAAMYVKNAEGGYSEVFNVTQTRYHNSKQTKDFRYVLGKSKEEGDTARFYIYKIVKLTGKVVHKIPLIDKTPSYVIDEVEDAVFVAEHQKTVAAYSY
ncbi:MAG: hypothetical protein N4A49_13045 [Marinifilaceae bacterium]|jgi:outer membrane protein assembly factor BamB|nr:hypothetical protein [Marinifilaceae bacterium]